MTPIHFETIAINDSNLYYDSYVAIALPVVYPSPSLGMLIETSGGCPLEKQCVRFVEKKMGKELNRNARDIYPNTKEPCINCGVLLYSSNWFGHIAYITKIESASFEIIEQNYISCGVISTRSIPFDSWKIRGFLK